MHHQTRQPTHFANLTCNLFFFIPWSLKIGDNRRDSVDCFSPFKNDTFTSPILAKVSGKYDDCEFAFQSEL